jgi:hypothetical protein
VKSRALQNGPVEIQCLFGCVALGFLCQFVWPVQFEHGDCLDSGNTSTPCSLRSIARRLRPASTSMTFCVSCSLRLTLSKMLPNFPNSVFTAASTFQTSFECFLNGERSGAYPERHQERDEGGRPGHHDMPVSLERID